MAVTKRKPKVQASDVAVGARTLEGVLIDLAEQIKANDARYANRSAQAEERSARIEERSAQLEERSAQLEEMATIALQTIAAVSQDLRALTLEMRTLNARTDDRLRTLENATAAE